MKVPHLDLALLLLAPLGSFAAGPAVESQGVNDPAAALEAVRFDGETFVLASKAEDSGRKIREFLPVGQKLESWTKLAAFHEFAELDDVDQYAEQLQRTVKEQYPQSPSAIQKNEKTGQVLVDFVAWPEGGSFVEFNIFRIEKNPSGGLIAEQYAQREYKNPEEFLKNLGPLRQKLLKSMAEKGLEKVPPQKAVARK